MSESTIRTAVYGIVNGVSDIGLVYDYERWAADWSAFLDLFKTGGKIKGWMVGYQGFADEDVEFGGPLLRTHTFIVRGYYGLDDSAGSEKTAATLAETVCNALDDSATLHDGGTYYNADPCILLFEARTFGGVLCHYSEITQRVTEFRA